MKETSCEASFILARKHKIVKKNEVSFTNYLVKRIVEHCLNIYTIDNYIVLTCDSR